MGFCDSLLSKTPITHIDSDMAKNTNDKKGAKVRYLPQYADQARRLCAMGMTDREIAQVLGVARGTVNYWKNKHPEFAAAMDREPLKPDRSKYRPEHPEQARKLCLLGYTNPELGEFFGVSKSTIDNWIADIDEFRDAVKSAKALSDAVVVDKLRQRAEGYTHKAVDFKVINDKVVQTTYDKHYPPDTTAGIFWLKNRQPQLWRDRRELQVDNAEELTPWSDIEASVDE